MSPPKAAHIPCKSVADALHVVDAASAYKGLCHAYMQVVGEGKLKLRSDDPVYLKLVDAFWNVLLPKMGPYLYNRGGNILMVQVIMICCCCRVC